MQDKTLRAVGYAAAHNKREIKRLYRRAFPAAERAPWRYFLRAGEAAQIVSYELDGAFVGFTISLPTPEFYYVFYLAIDEAARGRGCGSMILNEIVRTHGDLPVVLDMEAIDPAAPNAEQRVRRLHFYERNGFALTGYRYTAFGVTYDVLCRGGAFPAAAYTAFLRSRIKRFRN